MQYLAFGQHRFLVQQTVAQTVLAYAAALTAARRSAVAIVPIALDGAAGEIHLLLTPAVQLVVLPSDDVDVALDAAGTESMRVLQHATAVLTGEYGQEVASAVFPDFDEYDQRD